MAESSFEPNIVGFACNFCTYAGADLAGINRLSYPTNIRIIRVMCTGRLDMTFILRALQNGADGVFIGGCHTPSDCHFKRGNFKTERRVALLKKYVEQMGLNPDRVRLEWISASEGEKFATVMTEFTERVRELGPSPLRGD